VTGSDQERLRALEETQRATLNILEDFDDERSKLQRLQKATLNLLEDMGTDREQLGTIQRALLNILEDMEAERAKTEQARAMTEAVNRELEAFTYSVSHDLRAPLRAISGFAEAVTEDYAPRLDDEGRRFLGLIAENAHKMGRLIDDLLAFSRLGRQQIVRAEIDMEALAASVLEDMASQWPGRDVRIRIGAVPSVWGDTAMIRQVLVNLFSNAVKFTRDRGEPAIEFGFTPAPEPGAYYVRDNGVGFDMRYADKLFGVFQRLHSVTEFEGTGVGLALVHRIVTRHGGRVWAEGVVDQGAAFYFALPVGGAR
jgi:light-regulated signal transduction histidine kinase (bacteriophytochrome)